MYSIDINFLKDRQIVPDVPGGGRKKQSVPVNQKMLMYAGVLVGLLLPAAVGGFWFLQNNETANLQKRLDDLKGQNEISNKKLQEVVAIKKEADNITQDSSGLATVFDQLKPWSAMLQDIRERVPAGIQVSGIAQVSPATASSISNSTDCQNIQSSSTSSAPPAGVTLPTTDIVLLCGNTYSFSSINDLLLTLQQSPFFKAKDTHLITAQEKDNTFQLEWGQSNTNQSSQPPKLKKAVQFIIVTTLNDTPASKMLRELERKGALGLTTRIEYLQQKGVLK